MLTELDYLARISGQLSNIERGMYIAFTLTIVLLVIYVLWITFKDFF